MQALAWVAQCVYALVGRVGGDDCGLGDCWRSGEPLTRDRRVIAMMIDVEWGCLEVMMLQLKKG